MVAHVRNPTIPLIPCRRSLLSTPCLARHMRPAFYSPTSALPRDTEAGNESWSVPGSSYACLSCLYLRIGLLRSLEEEVGLDHSCHHIPGRGHGSDSILTLFYFSLLSCIFHVRMMGGYEFATGSLRTGGCAACTTPGPAKRSKKPALPSRVPGTCDALGPCLVFSAAAARMMCVVGRAFVVTGSLVFCFPSCRSSKERGGWPRKWRTYIFQPYAPRPALKAPSLHIFVRQIKSFRRAVGLESESFTLLFELLSPLTPLPSGQ